jgi:hypothetical protein
MSASQSLAAATRGEWLLLVGTRRDSPSHPLREVIAPPVLVSRPSLGFALDHGKAHVPDEDDPGRHRRPVAPEPPPCLSVGGDYPGAGDKPGPARPERLGPEGVRDLDVPGLGEGGELLGGNGWKVTCWYQAGCRCRPRSPVRDLGQDPEAEPERLLNQSPGAWGRESWPRSMAGTARSQKMPFTIGAACRSMPWRPQRRWARACRPRQGLKRSPSRPLATLAAPANRRDDAGSGRAGPGQTAGGEPASCAAAGRAALEKRAVRPSAARAGAAILGLDRSTGVRRGRSRP